MTAWTKQEFKEFESYFNSKLTLIDELGLDAEAIHDNSLANIVGVERNEQLACAKATVDMYIDQNCSEF